jgi:hypothetical protein
MIVIKNTINAYNDIIIIKNNMLKQQDVKEAIRELKDEFKEYRLSDIKALDYLLWSNRDDEEN